MFKQRSDAPSQTRNHRWHPRPGGRPGLVAFLLFITAGYFLVATPALAYIEPSTLTGTSCMYCHPWIWVDGVLTIQRYPAAGGDCASCHGESGDGFSWDKESGPHAGYSTTTRKCAACHSVHEAPSDSILLLPAATISATCFSCHDGTGGWGVYGTIEARTGTAAGSGHAYDQTSVIPGGDAGSGGAVSVEFSGPSGTLTCTDCHSPHGANVVSAFMGDRRRVRNAASNSPVSTKLLKQQPTGASTAVTSYGSDWCLTCHAGRSSDGVIHNHPVESSTTTWVYGNVAVLAADTATSATVMGGLGGVSFAGGGHESASGGPGNRGYLMPYPRTTQQAGHAPICQQCHEDTRSVGELVSGGTQGDAATASIAAADGVYWNGSTWATSTADNPLFQNFPHETENAYMLVETADDLCLNCHPTAQLP